MSAEDVYKALLAEHVDVGLATVYRVLTQFEQAGMLARNHFEGRQARCSSSTRASTTTIWSA